MILFSKCRLLLILFLSACDYICSGTSSPGKNGGNNFQTPIPRWQESWTASQAHGTAMAMTAEDCLVLFLRSPSTNVYKATYSTLGETELNGLRVETIDRSGSPASTQYAPSWFPLGSHSVCVMTGLALDVEHLSRTLQKKVDDHFFIYQKSMTTHAMTLNLSTMLQNECLFQGSRPYGIQSLIIGSDDLDSQHGSLCLYSMDPTGTWQSWGRGTAIGKFATVAKPIMAKKLKSTPVTNLDKAIECLLGTWNETCHEMGVRTKDEDDYEILILRKDPQNTRKSSLFRLPQDEIHRRIERIHAK